MEKKATNLIHNNQHDCFNQLKCLFMFLLAIISF